MNSAIQGISNSIEMEYRYFTVDLFESYQEYYQLLPGHYRTFGDLLYELIVESVLYRLIKARGEFDLDEWFNRKEWIDDIAQSLPYQKVMSKWSREVLDPAIKATITGVINSLYQYKVMDNIRDYVFEDITLYYLTMGYVP